MSDGAGTEEVRTTQLPITADGRHALIRQFHLRVLEGPDEGLTLASSGDRVAIGTHQSNQLVLTDPAVSRFHCEISIAGGRPTLSDLNSTNGTQLDAASIARAYPRDGSILSIGSSRLRFSLSDVQVKMELSQQKEFGLLVGQSTAMRTLFAVLEHAAQSDATILLTGETGTGKEATAESIHQRSARKGKPLVVVDCGGIPPALLESELFGHEKGAFTGALETRAGAFEQADGGTLFLDEIGELALDLQPKLLRALESRQIKRVGSSRYVPVNVRIIAATNRNLRADVNERRFRSDLYYRLAVIEVHLPSLRERPDDLPLLVDSLLDRLRVTDPAQRALVRSPEFLAEIAKHDWPGNIRELRNYVEACIALNRTAPPSAISTGTARYDTSLPLRQAREAAILEFERGYLKELLAKHHDDMDEAARAAGLSRSQLYRLMARSR